MLSLPTTMSNKKSPLRNIFLSCRKAKLQDVFEPTPMPKISTNDQKPSTSNSSTLQSHFSSSSWEKDSGGGGGDEDHTSTTTTFSFNNMNTDSAAATSPQYTCFDHQLDDQSISNRLMMSPSPKICHSVAVVKDSDDPYLDFKESMLQMIMERNIYSKEDLQELLRCLLQLNSSAHHDAIVRAFVEICNGDFSATTVSRRDCST